MLKRLCALGLLILALSPFTAPFQTWDADDAARPSQVAPLELLAAFRDDGDPCALMPVRVIASDRLLTLAPLFGLLASISSSISSDSTSLIRSTVLTADTGDSSSRTTVLRL